MGYSAGKFFPLKHLRMIKVSSDVDRVLVAKVHEAAQDQLFDSWDRLTAEEQSGLLA
jgi:hypothetical protein